jgi:ABC-type Fe3+ transport system substrate-binding protein
MKPISRRQALTAGAALGVGAAGAGALLTPGIASAAQPGARGVSHGAGSSVPEETRSLDELYRAAKAEGGKLVVYAGGDVASQQAGVVAAFGRQFPDIELTMVVDYSKFHDVRIDNQIATGQLIPDVTQLQTLQDFTRWKQQGRLLNYKPAGFSKVHDAFKDPDGAWVAIAVLAFSFMYNSSTLTVAPPKNPRQLADPRFKGLIASSYPNDDDAVLYLYSLYAQAYGWDWIAQLAAQQPQFGRGTNSPGDALSSGAKSVGVGAAGSLVPSSSNPITWVVADGHPFMAWGQRAAIFKQAAHPAAAKLYLNWQLSAATQGNAFNGWSVRTDVQPSGGLAPIWTYPNAHLDGFPRFMADRALAERLRQTFSLYFGEVQGAPSPGWLGLHPGR